MIINETKLHLKREINRGSLKHGSALAKFQLKVDDDFNNLTW